MKGTESTPNSGSIFDLSAMVTLIAALIYTIGWHYTAAFYQNFYLDLKYVDTSLERNLINGMLVIRKEVEMLFLFMIGGCLLVPYLRHLPLAADSHFSRSMFLSARWMVTIGMLLGLYFGGMYIGEKRAAESFRSHRRAGFKNYPTVLVHLKPVSSKEANRLIESRPKSCYHRLLDSGNHLFLFQTIHRAGQFKLRTPVVMLPHSRIEKVETFPHRLQCQQRIKVMKASVG